MGNTFIYNNSKLYLTVANVYIVVQQRHCLNEYSTTTLCTNNEQIYFFSKTHMCMYEYEYKFCFVQGLIVFMQYDKFVKRNDVQNV